MHNTKTEFIYHTHDPRYGPTYAASSKNGKHFVADFSDFYLAVNRIRKLCKPPKTEFIYQTYDPRYGPKYAASS